MCLYNKENNNKKKFFMTIFLTSYNPIQLFPGPLDNIFQPGSQQPQKKSLHFPARVRHKLQPFAGEYALALMTSLGSAVVINYCCHADIHTLACFE